MKRNARTPVYDAEYIEQKPRQPQGSAVLFLIFMVLVLFCIAATVMILQFAGVL